MSEAIIIVLISSIGGTLLTVLGSIIQQGMAARNAKKHAQEQKSEHEESKTQQDKHEEDNKESFCEIKEILLNQQEIIKNQQHVNKVILRDRLRFLLKQYQEKDTISYADKEDIDAMYTIYINDGHNGTIKTMYEDFNKKKVI